MAKQKKTKIPPPCSYSSWIEYVVLSGYMEDPLIIKMLCKVYSKTEESVRTSLTVKALQLQILKGLDHE